MVVNGSLSKTAVNGGAGAKVAGVRLYVAALTVITFLFLTGLFEKLPEATLAAVVVAAVIELVDIAACAGSTACGPARSAAIYRHATRADFTAALGGAGSGCCSSTPCPGLVIGIGVSFAPAALPVVAPHIAAWCVALTRRHVASTRPGPGSPLADAFVGAPGGERAVLRQRRSCRERC